MTSNQRKKMLTDKRLQRALAKRTVMYWCVTWLIVFTLPIMVRTITEQLPFQQLASQIIKDFWFPIIISVFMLPIVVWDSFRFSSRVAGPVFRVNQVIQQKCETGKPVEAIRVRDEDFCRELVENVNQLIEILDEESSKDSTRSNSKSDKEQAVASAN